MHHVEKPRPLSRLRVVGAVLAAALFPALTLGVSPAAARERPVRSLLEQRHDRVVVQKWDLSCGAAALATILNHQYGDPVPERAIAQAMMRRKEYLDNPDLVRAREGFSLLDLKRFVEARGYRGVGLGRLDLAQLERRAPAIVAVSHKGYNHFVVFRGRWQDRVLLADPAFGNVTMPVRQFEASWLEMGSIGRVAFVVALPGSFQLPNYLAPRPEDFVTLR